MIVVQLLELDEKTREYVRTALLTVADDGTVATDSGEPTGLEDTPVLDPESGAFVTMAENPRGWALGLPSALRTPYLWADVREIDDVDLLGQS